MNELVEIVNNQVVVSSRQVAEHFGKRHAEVIRAIENHIEALESTDAKVRWFNQTTYKDGKGEARKEYLMNRDGFSLLVMSFNNTRDVLEWKLKYIAAFNEMEKRLARIPTMTITEIVAHNAMQLLKQEQAIKETRQEVAAIREVVVVQPDRVREWMDKIIARIVATSGSDYARVRTESYRLLNKRMGVNVYTRKANREAKVGHKIPTIDIILSDKKLTEGYVAILKEYAIKYGVAA